MSGYTRPMKWHYFLIYFSLWVGAVILVLGSVMFISGKVYGEMADRIYNAAPAMRFVDIAYGLVLIGVAVYMIYTRFQLAGFRQGAPKKLLIVLALSPVLEWAYVLSVSAATGVAITALHSVGKFIGELIGSSLGIWLHKIYYDKRADLFVN